MAMDASQRLWTPPGGSGRLPSALDASRRPWMHPFILERLIAAADGARSSGRPMRLLGGVQSRREASRADGRGPRPLTVAKAALDAFCGNVDILGVNGTYSMYYVRGVIKAEVLVFRHASISQMERDIEKSFYLQSP